MMNVDIENVCEKLDILMLHILKLTEEKISVTLQLENQMKEGFIELAKARYIRGKESVGLIQVPQDTPISSLLDLELSFNKNPSIPHFDIRMKNKEENVEHQDPIRWFGVLVPQSLKTSQKRFQESIYLSVRMANIVAELTKLNEDFEIAKKLKNRLLTNLEE
ncbi:coiled-coil domain-containing protein 115 [Chelonus insularis]|uniref:coiled-coil domain-containing protein 115 n=1 Tax=Chelonus insularis TaxID=460826 RepID=UPI00158F65D1|nr:coiled-coil domain-containing protein 115-like [Chelonus insularis]XP_034936361.1 coiled-coil domain-containing protein 115-like [Chelonus insularis]